MSLRSGCFILALACSALAGCAGSGTPDNVSGQFDGQYAGTANATSGPCTSNPNYDVNMTVDDGSISGEATNGKYRFGIEGYVVRGGKVDATFVSTGASSASVGDIEGQVNSSGQLDGNWTVGIGAGCSGELSMAKAK